MPGIKLCLSPPSRVTPHTSSSPCSAYAPPVAASPSEGAAMETNPSASPQIEEGVEVEVPFHSGKKLHCFRVPRDGRQMRAWERLSYDMLKTL